MNTTFTLNQLEAYATIREDYYKLLAKARRINCVPVGSPFTSQDILEVIKNHFLEYTNDYKVTCIRFDGSEWELAHIYYVLSVHDLMNEMKRNLQLAHEGSVSVSSFYKSKKALTSALDRYEW